MEVGFGVLFEEREEVGVGVWGSVEVGLGQFCDGDLVHFYNYIPYCSN